MIDAQGMVYTFYITRLSVYFFLGIFSINFIHVNHGP